MKRTTQLRKLLSEKKSITLVGAHDAISAKLIQEAGFDGVWVSSFGTSAAQKCMPDANVLTMTESLLAASDINQAVNIPVVADCDNGYGNAVNVMRVVREFEKAGIAGISIEDNPFPKRCSLYPGDDRDLVAIDEMAGRIRAAKRAQTDADFFVIARTEAFIAGLGIEEALKRAHAYADAGADAILVHSKAKTAEEVASFARQWKRPVPLVAVPTKYGKVTSDELEAMGYQVIIFANQPLRASIKAMQETLAEMRAKRFPDASDQKIVPLEEVFRLVGQSDLDRVQKEFITSAEESPSAVILAAGFEKDLMPLIAARPKTLLELKGKSILERQVSALKTAGVSRIGVVRGYLGNTICMPQLKYFENPRYADTYILHSLFCAEEMFKGPVIVLYGDIVFDETILQKLLRSKGDIRLVVDRSWRDHYASASAGENGNGKAVPKGTELVLTSSVHTQNQRFLSPEEPDTVTQTGTNERIDPSKAAGEFIGIAYFSARGIQIAKEAYRQALKRHISGPFQEASSIEKASLVDLVQELIDLGHEISTVDIYKGWLEVDTFEDYRRAWEKVT
ncbi:MAG: isocitrate lyase/phosphoenolpyruvate mutase family protein [Candidatus Omnitrophica bacterium]|nr:isocitrate lyase/phosphoenolpyruvate mutase family protein [Candidatus Omnitrophota bacterium]